MLVSSAVSASSVASGSIALGFVEAVFGAVGLHMALLWDLGTTVASKLLQSNALISQFTLLCLQYSRNFEARDLLAPCHCVMICALSVRGDKQSPSGFRPILVLWQRLASHSLLLPVQILEYRTL